MENPVKRPEEDAGLSERPTTPQLPPDWSRNSTAICEHCNQTDWSSFTTFAAKGLLLDGCIWALRPINESHRQLAASSCRICRILSRIKPPSLDQDQCMVYAKQLSTQESSSAVDLPSSHRYTVLSIAPDYTDGTWLAEYSGCLLALPRNDDKESYLIHPRSINYDKLKRLARSCEANHGSFCTDRSLHQVRGLRVIDVSARMVVEAPENCRYLALSYVWGQQPDSIIDNLLRGAPLLIEDAMSVAVALECKYLWVDRYDRPQDKHDMISQMGQVYANAFATIIAAAGDSVQMGLPGVSICPRQPQEWVDIQSTTLLQLPYGEGDLLSSKWASRGWTYQEGYLSRRRIIFTPNQVIFLCNNQYLEEHVDLLLKDQGGPPQRRLVRLIGSFPTFGAGPTQEKSSLFRHIEEYTLRELSYSSDSLNAFRGVLNYYTTGHFRQPHPPTHLGWGVLAEQSKAGLCVHLDWYHQAPAERRHEFPSWTWTGWGGPLKFWKGVLCRRKNAKPSSRLPDLAWEVSVEAEGEKTMDMCDFASICETKASVANNEPCPISLESSPRRLLITCRVLPVHFLKVNMTEAQRKKHTEVESEDTGSVFKVGRPVLANSLAVIQVWEGVYIGSPYHLDQDLKQNNLLTGLLFLSVCASDLTSFDAGCLLVRQVEEASYERVGVARDILPYRLVGDKTWAQLIFLDARGNILDKIKVPEMALEQLFHEVSERKTIWLL